MKKRIWILNHYATDMFIDHGGRHYAFSKYLIRAGYDVRIFCAGTVHNSDTNLIQNGELYREDCCDGIPFVFVRARSYRGNGKQRILNMFDFFRRIFAVTRHFERPDVILGSSVHPLTCVAAIRLSRRYHCKNIVEIRDLWPESIVAYGIKKKSNPIVQMLYRLEKWIYAKADSIVFTMEGGRDYIIEKGWDKQTHGGPVDLDKVHHINNGVDLEVFDANREAYAFADADLDDPNTFKVVYTGSIRKVNNLGLLLDTAKQVTDPRIKFLVWGDGDELPSLRRRATEECITNVVFKGLVEKKYIPSIVSRGDLNFVHSTPSPLFRFGISPNKLFDYLAAGKPILCDFLCVYNLSVQYGAGISVDEPTPHNIAEAIRQLAMMDSTAHMTMRRNARTAASDYDFKYLTQKLIDVIKG